MSFGRQTIYTGYRDITPLNVKKIVRKAMETHELNVERINFLIEYEKGDQPILYRVKETRPEINSRVVENHATQVASFWNSYVFGSPIRYVQKADNDSTGNAEADDKNIGLLNEMCFEENKHVKDQELAKTFLVCGIAHRIATPVSDYDEKSDFSPFHIVNLDPRSTFIVYGSDIFHSPKLAVTYWVEEIDDNPITKITHFTAYSNEMIFEFTDTLGDENVVCVPNPLGIIPIVEYKQDYEKMGCFERVVSLMDAINICTSDRVDAMTQFVQSFLWFDNVDIDTETFQALKENGGFVTESTTEKQARIQLIESSLNQTEVQTLSNYLYDQMLQICSMPSRNAQSGSTTGQSSMLAGGWQEADENAKRLEQMFDEGEKKFLAVVKAILDSVRNPIQGAINLRDIELKFSRNKVSNMLVKTQGLLNMKSFGIHPRIAIQTSDLFTDPQQVYNDSKEYVDIAYGKEHGESAESDLKDLQSNPKGDDASKVTESQNEQMSFVSK